MNLIVEILIGVIVLFYIISGIRRGLIRQLLDIIGIVAAFIGAFYLASRLASYLGNRLNLHDQIALIISAVVIFIGILVLFHLLGLTLQKAASIVLLGPLDRFGGGLFGAVKGVLLVSLILVILLNIPVPGKLKRVIRRDPVAAAIYPVLPRLFNLVLSRAPIRLDYWTGEIKAFEKAKKKMEDAGEGMRKGRET